MLPPDIILGDAVLRGGGSKQGGRVENRDDGRVVIKAPP